MLESVVAVIVHHRRFPGVLETVNSVIGQGVRPGNLIVVDNSEDPLISDSLRRALPEESRLMIVKNAGYGNAVNVAFNEIASRPTLPSAVLVGTHEVLMASGALSSMVGVMASSPDAGAVGPVLVRDALDGPAWSAGGRLSPRLRLPRHVLEADREGTADREWLDGALVLYRWTAVRGLRFDERFRMYFEETDLHARLMLAGWRVLLCKSARASQSTGGIPPEHLGRSGVFFAYKRAGCGTAFVVALYYGARLLVRTTWGERRRSVTAYLSGLSDAQALIVNERKQINAGSQGD